MYFYALNHVEFIRVNNYKMVFKIWKLLEVTYEEISQMKYSRLITLTREYKLFKMEPNESIHEIYNRFIT